MFHHGFTGFGIPMTAGKTREISAQIPRNRASPSDLIRWFNVRAGLQTFAIENWKP
jgi:hypothetical protein